MPPQQGMPPRQGMPRVPAMPTTVATGEPVRRGYIWREARSSWKMRYAELTQHNLVFFESNSTSGPPADAVRQHLQRQYRRAAAAGSALRRRSLLELFSGAGRVTKAMVACGASSGVLGAVGGDGAGEAPSI